MWVLTITDRFVPRFKMNDLRVLASYFSKVLELFLPTYSMNNMFIVSTYCTVQHKCQLSSLKICVCKNFFVIFY